MLFSGLLYFNYGRNPALFSEVRFISLLPFYVIFLLWQRKWIILTKIKAGSLLLRLLHISTDSNVVSQVIDVTLELWDTNARERSAATQPTKTIVNHDEHCIRGSSTRQACNGADGVTPCPYRWLSPTTSAMNPPQNAKNPFLFYNIYAIFSPTIFNEMTSQYYNLAYFFTQTTFCAATVAAARMPILLRIHEIQ